MQVVMWLAQVGAEPDISQIPGGEVIQRLTNGLMGWSLMLCLAAMIFSAVAWAFGSRSQNYHQAVMGKRGVLIAGAAALVIGAAPTLINWLFAAGSGVAAQ